MTDPSSAARAMRTPAEWEDWCDAVWHVRRSYPTWHELLTAVQQDARGDSTLVDALLAKPTVPDYGPTNGRRTA